MLYQRVVVAVCAGFLLAVTQLGCGPDNSATIPGVDNSVVHTDAEMEEMAKQNASDMRSQ